MEIPYSQPYKWNGSFYLGQYDPLNLATDLTFLSPDDYTLFGGDMSLYQSGEFNQVGGQVDAITEGKQRADALKVANRITAFPDEAIAVEVSKKFGQQSQVDPTRFVPYWTPEKDRLIVIQNMQTGSGFMDIVNALRQAGYLDMQIADTICLVFSDYFVNFNLPSGQLPRGAATILAQILGVPMANRYRDPVFYIDPATGNISTGISEQVSWIDHVGGEWVNFAVPFQTTHYISAMSYIETCFNTRYNPQNGGILMSLGADFLNHFADVTALGVELDTYCVAQGINMGDLICQTPITPTQKKYLSQSKFYNPLNENPPTYAGAFIEMMLAGTNPLVLKSDPNSSAPDIIDTPLPNVLGNNNAADELALQTWATKILNYYAAQPAGRPNNEQSLLMPFAKLFAPQK